MMIEDASPFFCEKVKSRSSIRARCFNSLVHVAQYISKNSMTNLVITQSDTFAPLLVLWRLADVSERTNWYLASFPFVLNTHEIAPSTQTVTRRQHKMILLLFYYLLQVYCTCRQKEAFYCSVYANITPKYLPLNLRYFLQKQCAFSTMSFAKSRKQIQ